ncbi:MAG: hypothetical protein J0H23_02100 [Micrococcales bacterium]|nr:hypothetical protein [Micrococcales bacterium]
MSLSTRARTAARHAVRSALVRGWFPARRFDWGADGDEVPVLMCLWNRPERITDVLELLDAQDHAPGVHLYLWNNRRSDHGRYLDALRAFTASGALRAVSIVKSPHNIGSIARFYWARKLELVRSGRAVVVLDDDEDITSRFIAEAVGQYDASAVTAWWAWRFKSGYYWDREFAGPGEPVDHVGPGGSILSTAIVADPSFFTGIPDEFRMLDDVWLSHYAPAHGFELRKLVTDIRFVLDETNQFHGQSDIKPRFHDYLVRHG